MSRHRAIPSAAFVAAALLVLAPSAATAQSGISDVIRAGRVNGVELSAQTIAWMESQGEDAFEFQRVWKQRVDVMRANRAAFDAAQRQRPSRGATQRVTTAQLQAAGAALDRPFRMPILLGLPSGRSAPYARAAYQDRMFGAGGGGVYSLTSLYDEMSRGIFAFTGEVIGWAPLPNTSAEYYTAPTNFPPEFGNTPLFLSHTVAAADVSTDFGLYDNDGADGVPNSGDDDGFVDLAAFMYPAHGRECGAGAPGIWAHRASTAAWGIGYISTNDVSAEGGFIRVADYIIQGGLDCDGSSLQEIGVVAHEAGHGFGLPDLYDTDDCQAGGRCDDGIASEGVGEWDLMGTGNWNEPHSPAHMSAHSKAFLGWVDVVTILADTALVIEPIIESATAYRIDTTIPGQYFLLENRQALGSDVHLANTGLLIWHVDSTVYASRRTSNGVNNIASAKGLDLEEADGQNHLDRDGTGNRGDAGDPWPGSANRTTFHATSSPSSAINGGGESHIAVTNIVETAGGTITVGIDVPDLIVSGDVNDDMAVTDADLSIVTAYVIGETGLDFSHIGRADVDEDGDTDARDAYIIHAFLDGVNTDAFPVGDLIPVE